MQGLQQSPCVGPTANAQRYATEATPMWGAEAEDTVQNNTSTIRVERINRKKQVRLVLSIEGIVHNRSNRASEAPAFLKEAFETTIDPLV